MLREHTINAFTGFGDSNRPGEYYFSKGMSTSQNGIKPSWSVTNQIELPALCNFVTQPFFSNGQAPTLMGGGGTAIYNVNGTLVRTTPSTVYGLIGDQKGRLLYLNGQNLGKYDGTTWNDSWKACANNFGTAWTQHAPMEVYEDSVLIGLGNAVGRVNNDDSINDGVTSYALNFPANFAVEAIRANKNGILLGVNFMTRGALVLWDNISTRSVTPWIWLDTNIKAILPYNQNWIVVTSRNVLITNGYTVEKIAGRVDSPSDELPFFNVGPQGAAILEKFLIISQATPSDYGSRFRSGLHILNLETRTWEYSPFGSVESEGVSGPIHIDNGYNTVTVVYQSSIPSKTYAARLKSAAPGSSTFISKPIGDSDNEKTALNVKLELGLANEDSTVSGKTSFTAEAKLYDMKRPLWGYAQTNATAGATNQIRVDGTVYTLAEIGDEITVTEGTNAGQIRHIASIANKGTNTETWTLDANLGGLTEQNVYVDVSPWKSLGTQTITDATSLKELTFDAHSALKGKKFQLKLILSGMSGARVELRSLSLIYDDKGPQP